MRATSAGEQPRRAGRAEVHEVVAAVGERLDDRRQAGHADAQPRVEGHLDLGDGAEAVVDVRVGAHDLDVEAGHATLADLLHRARDAVHAADAVDDERDAPRLGLGRCQPCLLAAQEADGGRVGHDGNGGRRTVPGPRPPGPRRRR